MKILAFILFATLQVAMLSTVDAEDCTIRECAQQAVEAATQAKALAEILVPKGAVMAFALTECPTGWGEYHLAYGRFIRGIDRSGNGIDPEGQRKPGAIQGDAFQSHTHRLPNFKATPHFDGQSGPGTPFMSDSQAQNTGAATGNHVREETRPKNVALLYCIRK